MFRKLIAQLRDAVDDLKRVRREAQKKGWPLEEIHRRMLHLERAIKLVEQAHQEFLVALGEDLLDDESEETDEDDDE